MKPYLTLLLIFSVLFTGACSFEGDDKDSYKVEGDIYDLQGEVALSINDNEVLVIEGGSNDSTLKRFVFRQELLEGEEFKISIIKQPESQYCQFYGTQIITGESFSGIVENQDFIDINIDCLSYNRISNQPQSLSVGNYHTCFIDSDGAQCMGRDSNYAGNINITQLPMGLSNPKDITSAAYHGCVTDDTGIVCWGEEDKALVPLNLVNPRELQVGEGFSCALDDEGLKCWGGWDLLSTTVPFDIENATNLTVGRASACVLDSGKPICRATSDQGIIYVPDILDHVTYISIYESTACAIQDSKLYCWGDWVNPETFGADLSDDLLHINLGITASCLANKQVVSCTDASMKFSMKDMVNIMPDATNIGIGRYHVCAMNDKDILCFGNASANPESTLTSN